MKLNDPQKTSLLMVFFGSLMVVTDILSSTFSAMLTGTGITFIILFSLMFWVVSEPKKYPEKTQSPQKLKVQVDERDKEYKSIQSFLLLGGVIGFVTGVLIGVFLF